LRGCVLLRLKTDGLRFGSWGKAMKKTLDNFQPLKPAEQKLLECCQSGEMAVIGEERPTEKTEENEIRAEFLRWLILTKDIDIDLNGIQCHGAFVSDIFYANNAHCVHIFVCIKCVFEEKFYLSRAVTKSIFLNGSLFCKGIEAGGLICEGDLTLREGFHSQNEVFFSGSTVEGNFDCSNASFQALDSTQKALHCERIIVKKNVFLNNGFSSKGSVFFLGAKIMGSFYCTNSRFESFDKEQSVFILCCELMVIKGGLFLRENCIILNGIFNLTNATVGALADNKYFWEQETLKVVYLDGFKYGHIHGDISASFRLKNMLSKMPEFTPQPYKQLAKVLREMGDDRDADEVMIALHDKRLEMSKESWSYKVSQKLYRWISRYGYRPIRALKIILVSVWFIFGCVYWYGANVGVFAPSNPLVFQNKDYNCTINSNGTPWGASPKDYNVSNNWYKATPPEYTTFQPFLYSLDIILPVVDLKLEKDWGVVVSAPDNSLTDIIPFCFTTTNHLIRFLTWVESIVGWGLSLMLVAILSGLAKNEKE